MAEPSLPGLPIILRVFDIARDEAIREIRLNYNSRHARKKIAKTQFWALNSGYATEIVREQDDKLTPQP